MTPMKKHFAGLVSSCVLGLSPVLAMAELPAPLTDADFPSASDHSGLKVHLGELLMFDKILSGNQNISCATCHHTLAGTGDGLSLPVGEGGEGLGITRNTGRGLDAVPERVPRNAPAVYNLGAKEIFRMFHDGRVVLDASSPSGCLTPAGSDLPEGLDSILACQAMFPVTSGTEMAGQPGENDVADAAAAGDLPLVWDLLASRVASIPKYGTLFASVYPDVNGPQDITMVHIANAIDAYEAMQFRADNSPFDRYLRGETGAMSQAAIEGMNLFYGAAQCSTCHSGALQTDQEFYAIAMPQIGPGKGDGVDGHEDFGRERETGNAEDRYRFRTPTLRNIALTAPYGHAGAFDTLISVVRHHVVPRRSLDTYSADRAALPPNAEFEATDFVVQEDPARREAIYSAEELPVVRLTTEEQERIVDFLHALTDPSSLDSRSKTPPEVPSGLPVYD